MMFGTQEILIISTIVLGVIFIPRMMNPKKPAPRIVRPARKKLSGKVRLGIAASVAFPIVVAAFMQPWRNDPIAFLYVGGGPVILGWLVYWVLQGFNRK